MVAGVNILGVEGFKTPSLSVGITSAHPASVTRGLLDAVSQAAGVKTPVSLVIRSLPLVATAQHVWSFFDDFYNRMYFIPQTLEFGAVGSDTSQIFRIWNAYAQTVTANSIVVEGGVGISYSGISIPQALKPLELKAVTVSVSAAGPPKLETSYTFNFSIGPPITLPINGERSKVWGFPHNWADSLQVTYDFQTEIITSRSHREQRIAVRQSPRKRLQFGFLATDANLRKLDNQMASWNGNTWVVPEFPRSVKSTSTMAAHGLTIQVDSGPSWLMAGLTVVLIGKTVSEARTVLSVVGSTVTFSGSSSTPWPAGTRIHPGLASTMSANNSSQRHTDSVATMSVQFDVLPASENPESNGVAPTTFGNRELFLTKYNWGESVTIDFSHFTEKVDFGRGAIAQFRPAPFSSRELKVVFLNKNSTEAEALLKFFRRMKGQRGEFYRPTFSRDLVPKLLAVSGSTFLRFEGLDLLSYAEDTVHKAVFITLADGTTIPNTIKAITKIEDFLGVDTQFEFDNVWPVDIDPAASPIVSWMPVWRLASDTAVFTWRTDTICDVQFAMKICEALTAET